MRIRLLIILLCLFCCGKFTAFSQGECLGGGCAPNGAIWQFPGGTFTSTSSDWSVVANNIWQGEWALYNVTAGSIYEWSLCASDGGIVFYDAQLTLYNNATLAQICYSDDFCGNSSAIFNAPKIRWVATFTGVVRVQVNQFNCLSPAIGLDTRLMWRCASCPGSPPPSSTGDNCSSSIAFCTGTTYTFPNNTNQPSLGIINCLLLTPNPVWYYMEIDSPGNLDINISQFDIFGFPIDVDFNLWGPFSSLSAGCAAISAGTAPNVDCSYSPSAFEQANIPNAQTGEVYILLLTNFDNLSGTITFNSTAGSTATTNCDILCTINNVTAVASTCNSTTNTYNIAGVVNVTNPPSSGILTISSSCGGASTLSPPFANSINYTLTGLVANGNNCTVTATFSADETCTATQTYTAPAACNSVSLNCPQYASVSNSPSTACSNQTYYLEVENTGCNGQIFFTVAGNYGTPFGDEISWAVFSNSTNQVLASGNWFVNPQIFNLSFGPFNPALIGNILRLEIYDSFGDGFDANGTISVLQGSTVIAGPFIGNFGAQSTTIFGANISISPATITVQTPAGPSVQTMDNCRDFRVPLSIDNTNFCNTIQATLPWTITCNTSGAVLATGSNTLTVYPNIPVESNDIVSINWDSSTCDWEVSPNNDCDQADIGSVFTISPNPSTLNYGFCQNGTQNFTVTYNGLGAGPDCCETGGPPVPINYTETYDQSDIQVVSSPFGGFNNAVYIQVPPSAVGGAATSVSLTLGMNGYCYPNFTDNSYWVTVYLDGNIVSDVQFVGGPSSFNQTFNLANLAGYDQNSVIEVYIYPNVFQIPIGGTFVNFIPFGNCPNMTTTTWTASSFNLSIDADFSELGTSPANCVLPVAAPYTCLGVPNIVPDEIEDGCSGSGLGGFFTWIADINASNPPPNFVYSSVPPVAGSVAPDGIFPNGVNTTSSPIVQTISAYAYCDANNNGTVDVGDAYSLISTYTITIYPSPNSGTTASTTVCASAPPLNLFNLLGGTPQTTGTWSGPGVLTGGHLGTFTPGINPGGTYIYTVAPSSAFPQSPCANVSTAVNVTVIPGPSAAFDYLSAPFCVTETNPQSPTITGTAGGTFSSSPAGLNINLSGIINPSTSLPGTYTVTYTVAGTGGCGDVTESREIVITEIPPTPVIVPPLPCAGVSTVFTASGGSWYEFTVNGNSQGPPSNINTFTSPVLALGDVVCVNSFPPPPFVFNGQINESEWGSPLATSTGGPASGFGDGNRMDAIYLKNGNGFLYGAIAAQVENNSNNRVLLFIDCLPGGFNNLGAWTNRTNAPYFSVENLNSGITFDPGFAPDYVLAMNEASNEAFFDLYNMVSNTNNYLGSSVTSNLLGYAANGGGFNAGFEFAIPKSALANFGSNIQVFAMIVNDPGFGNPTFVSNQFLTRANNGESNYGDGAIQFGFAAPDPISFSLSADCFSTACVTVIESASPITGFTYLSPVCADNSPLTPALNSGFTVGGDFSAPAGLAINSSTGIINVSGSTPGTYTVTYSISGSGCSLPGTSTFTVTIEPLPTTNGIYHE